MLNFWYWYSAERWSKCFPCPSRFSFWQVLCWRLDGSRGLNRLCLDGKGCCLWIVWSLNRMVNISDFLSPDPPYHAYWISDFLHCLTSDFIIKKKPASIAASRDIGDNNLIIISCLLSVNLGRTSNALIKMFSIIVNRYLRPLYLIVKMPWIFRTKFLLSWQPPWRKSWNTCLDVGLHYL